MTVKSLRRTFVDRSIWGMALAAVVAGTVAIVAPPANADPEPQVRNPGVVVVANGLTPAAAHWQPFPTVYRNVYDSESRLRFAYATILTISQTRDLYRSGWLAPLSASGIPDVAPIATTTKRVIEERRVVERRGCVVITYDPVARYSPTFKTRISGRVYSAARYECRP